MGVHLARLAQRRGEDPERGGGLLRALEREDHVVGGEGRAVVELHSLAQREAPGGGTLLLPRRGERRDRGELPVVRDQPLEDLVVDEVVGALVLRVRVGGEVVALGGPAKRRGPRREGEGRQEEQLDPRLRGDDDHFTLIHVTCSQLSARWVTSTLAREAHGITCRWMGMW